MLLMVKRFLLCLLFRWLPAALDEVKVPGEEAEESVRG